METMPMPLDALAAAPGGLAEFRISAPREIEALLRQLTDGSVQLNLNGADGSVVSATIWTLDAARGGLGFNVDPSDPALQGLLECQEAVVVGYLDAIKVQFDVANLVLVRGGRACVLTCSWPRVMYRFQRRGAYRVRPLQRSSPSAKVPHPTERERTLRLRIVDVSIGGCALFLPDTAPQLQPGSVLQDVQIDLDAETRFVVDLKLHHVTAINAESKGVRLGCEFSRVDPTTQRTLQRFIDLTQKRGKLLSID